MAENNTGATRTFHLANNVTVLVIAVVAIAAFIGGWYAGTHHKKVGVINKPVSQFITYKNTENGFRLQYPSEWASPSFSKSDISDGNSYQLSFYKKPDGNLKYSIVLTMIKGQNAITDTNVKLILKNDKSAFAASDSTSYATVANSPKLNVSSLSAVQIVSLPKIGITAASMTYQINGSGGNCPANKFAANSSGACIEKTDYDTVNQVLKSLKSL